MHHSRNFIKARPNDDSAITSMKSKSKCPKCGSRRIETKITWISLSHQKTKKGIDRQCLDCKTILCQPIDLSFYE